MPFPAATKQDAALITPPTPGEPIMGTEDVIRAWKELAHQQGLTDEQLAALPHGPAGELELSEEDLGIVAGGYATEHLLTAGCCGGVTNPSTCLAHCCPH